MNIIWYLFIPGVIGIPIFTIAFFKYPRYAIAGLIIAKPIIDVSWDYNIFLNINFLKIYAGLFAILGVIYIIYKRINILQHPISLIWLIFLGLNFISTFIISDSTLFVNKIDYILRILNGFVALILFAHLFDYEKDKKFVLSVFIVAGIVPMLFWLITVLSGNPIVSNDELRRILGPYHRFWQFNFYAMQTIICCLAYLAITNTRKLKTNNANNWLTRINGFLKNYISVQSVLLFIMVIICVSMIYTCYSKSGWITLVTILFVWFLLRKKIIQTVLIPIIIAVIIFVNPFAQDFQKTFQNEIDYFIHDSDTKEMVFRGRMIRWENGMQDFGALPVLNKLFGSKETIGYPENYYLRVLWDSGIIGFIVYVILLVTTGYFLIKRCIKHKNPIVLGAILVWIFYLLNSIGSYPMFNPAFQWFMWGTIGIALHSNSMTEQA